MIVKRQAKWLTFDKGKLELLTTWGYFLNNTSPIKYTSSDGTERFAIFGRNIAYIEFKCGYTDPDYLIITSITGTYRIKCERV